MLGFGLFVSGHSEAVEQIRQLWDYQMQLKDTLPEILELVCLAWFRIQG